MAYPAVSMLRILQVSPSDRARGAERIALSLHQAYRGIPVESTLAVGRQNGSELGVVRIDNERCQNTCSKTLLRWAEALLAANQAGLKGAGRLSRALALIAEPVRQWRLSRGVEEFDYPASRKLLDLVAEIPHVVHCHNLHSGYFDLRSLPDLARKVPVVLTLHDAWLLSGHCAHGGRCQRWRAGCGNCPDLGAYPPIQRDASALNWQRKARIFARCRLHVATPSQWLMDAVNASILSSAIVSQRVIANGIDVSVFHPGNRGAARVEKGIDTDTLVLLFAAYYMGSGGYKDYDTLRAAVEIVAKEAKDKCILFLAVGDASSSEVIRNTEFRCVPFQQAPEQMAQYYRAADIYIHAAKVDTFPNTILEAMACGTAVVATSVGGIPEQIQDGVTGYLTPPGDPSMMAARIMELSSDATRLRQMGQQAATVAQRMFTVERMATDYVGWYQEILDQANGGSV